MELQTNTYGPNPLKALRNGLRMTQDEMAEALGLSRKAVNELEAKAELDQRTRLAVQHLYNERTRLYSNHAVTPLETDVELADAMIIWDKEMEPRVKVVDRSIGDDDRYSSSYGVCNIEWQEADDIGRLLRLFSRFVELTTKDGIPAKVVHKAFSVIPQYRWAMHASDFEEGVDRD